MFKMQRSILAQELESRFQFDGTSDNNTLFVLKLDPSVNTTAEDGIFSLRTRASHPHSPAPERALVLAEYQARLRRRRTSIGHH